MKAALLLKESGQQPDCYRQGELKVAVFVFGCDESMLKEYRPFHPGGVYLKERVEAGTHRRVLTEENRVV